MDIVSEIRNMRIWTSQFFYLYTDCITHWWI